MDAVTRLILRAIGWREQPGVDADGRPYLAMIRRSEYFHVYEASALTIAVETHPYADGKRTSKQVSVKWRAELCDLDEKRITRASSEELHGIAAAADVCASSQMDVMRPALEVIAACAPLILREGSIYAGAVARMSEREAVQIPAAADA